MTYHLTQTRDSRGIYLPHHIEPISHIAIDIGGSLAKVVYFTRSPHPPNGHNHVGVAIPSRRGSETTTPIEEVATSVGGNGEGSNGNGIGNGSGSAIGGSWNPVLNGALTPELLTKTDNKQTESGGGASGSSTRIRAASQEPSGSGEQLKRPRKSTNETLIKGKAGKMIRRGSLPPNFPGGTLNFVRFETEHIDDMVSFLKELISTSAATNHVTEERMKKGVKILATGGGAHKFYDMLVEELGVEVSRQEEMECLIIGLGFITCIPDEVFWYSDELVTMISHPKELTESNTNNAEPATASTPAEPDPTRNRNLPRPSPDPPSYQVTFDTSGTPQFPCLLVNIGSGVSVIKVDEDGRFERVSGTSVGGGTLWGLLSLLTDAESFDGECDDPMPCSHHYFPSDMTNPTVGLHASLHHL